MFNYTGLYSGVFHFIESTWYLCHAIFSKADPGLLVRVIPMLSYMMEDSNSSVIKRVMTAFMQLYMMALTVCDTYMYTRQ